jgi:predicted transcriptional regulator of viral defense system
METNLRSLSPQEAKVVLSLRADDRSLVSSNDIAQILDSKVKARKVAQNLVRKGWLSRLVGGRYMLLPPEHGPLNIGENNVLALASAIVADSYIGWWAAASFHGFTTQKPMTVTVAVRHQMRPRQIEGTQVRFVSLVDRKYFGWQTETAYGRPIRISTKAKTLADCLDRPDLVGGPSELARIVFGASRDVDTAEVLDIARKMGSTALLQRLGALADLTGWTIPPDLRIQMRTAIPKSYRSTLGRAKRRAGDIGYVPDWGVLINVAPADLLSDVPRLRQAV